MPVIVIFIFILVMLLTYACGPEANCRYLNEGEVMENSNGTEWCDIDRDGSQGRGDYDLAW